MPGVTRPTIVAAGVVTESIRNAEEKPNLMIGKPHNAISNPVLVRRPDLLRGNPAANLSVVSGGALLTAEIDVAFRPNPLLVQLDQSESLVH